MLYLKKAQMSLSLRVLLVKDEAIRKIYADCFVPPIKLRLLAMTL